MDFSAVWCGPCKAVAPLFAQFAKEYTNIIFLKVDVDTNPVRIYIHVCALPMSGLAALYLAGHTFKSNGGATFASSYLATSKTWLWRATRGQFTF